MLWYDTMVCKDSKQGALGVCIRSVCWFGIAPEGHRVEAAVCECCCCSTAACCSSQTSVVTAACDLLHAPHFTTLCTPWLVFAVCIVVHWKGLRMVAALLALLGYALTGLSAAAVHATR